MKKLLKKLKLENGDILEIKFVGKKLRNLLNKSNITDPNNTDSQASANIDHDSLIGKSFWGFVKRFFKMNVRSFPSVKLAECTSYFTKTLSAISPTKTSNIPSWIPTFASPQTPFNLDPRPINRLQMSSVI